jgi:membrane-associated phospholipid phosphatase
MDLQNAISMSIGIIYFIPIVLYFITRQHIHLKALYGLFGTLGLSEMLKKDFIKEMGPRPKGAKHCNLLCNDGNQEGKPGMPSGHSSTVTFFSAFYYQQTNNIWIKAGLILYAFLMMLSRYLKYCHSLPQIICGALLGLSTNAFVQFI